MTKLRGAHAGRYRTTERKLTPRQFLLEGTDGQQGTAEQVLDEVIDCYRMSTRTVAQRTVKWWDTASAAVKASVIRAIKKQREDGEA